MKAATEGAVEPASALTALGNAIADYVKDNAEILFSWTAAMVNPPFTPDPTVIANGEIVDLTIVLTPSMATTQPAALSALAGEIQAGFMTGMYNITDSGFATSPAVMADIPPLTISIMASDRDSAYLQLANQIIDWITAYVPATPCAGTHGNYTGSGSATTIQ